ncbi:nucleotidyltransferase substrate binding protein, HI0074 family [Aminomonas paucivorans DSM 12260]|uniref:Nucleotidyltransferase substrate binding protein, HI0074 family n=1 Tax=Aminomonas paucivorans DSM 12260 TaxID=584708 RepID=E3CVY3_9BACT|nr:HI0074 family nucleotidyltransferase substrate-binding subunit [Aminomonas paucivorans]EFQ24238.1 nucleotidyltransferase substrate binding protein, HI0074 family [Aminomonas paucivorans DSM 12260]
MTILSRPPLDLTALRNALSQLDRALEFHERAAQEGQDELAEQLRAACIQAFEFTYELSWKMLRRYGALTEPNPQEVKSLPFPDLIRWGCERGLVLSDWTAWMAYREARGTTSHTYDGAKAQAVFAVIPAFRDEARFLLARLEERIAWST